MSVFRLVDFEPQHRGLIHVHIEVACCSDLCHIWQTVGRKHGLGAIQGVNSPIESVDPYVYLQSLLFVCDLFVIYVLPNVPYASAPVQVSSAFAFAFAHGKQPHRDSSWFPYAYA